ncbi:membrane protein insertase YidC [Sungkyunkwania multivorans]|uniref:Membrane protein insertase YidC n=1 Tax=Sungkyunkwania multivorans TaxID=1173618 RepID=A0ABW3CU19_9FLAO
MEEKKFDPWQLVGMVLIAGILTWMMFNNSAEKQEELEAEQNKTEQVEGVASEQNTAETKIAETPATASPTDSLAVAKLQSSLGAFAYSATLPSASDSEQVLENDLIYAKVSNKGGQISELYLKEFVTYDSLPLHIVKDGNTSFNINFGTTDNHILNTRDLYFEPSLSKNGENTVLSMKLKVAADRFLEYRYELNPNSYMIDFSVRSQGLSQVLNSNGPINLDWQMKGLRRSKSVTYENRYTRLSYEHDGGKHSKLGATGEDEEVEEGLSWISFRQHFFSAILLTDIPFKEATLSSVDLVEDEGKDVQFTKAYASSIPLTLDGGELNYGMDFYFGPTDFNTMRKYDRGIENSIPFGWGIFGWINKWIFTPLFGFLSGFLPFGIAIIAMTIIVKLLLSFVQYKQYVSQAKMKVLKPEIAEINEKYKDDAMKKQQETMKLYNKAGASPMSGCLPAVLQMPVFYALFMFFPTAFILRQKPFLWAEDLSSYDVVAELPFNIPFYGDHVSLFPILASIAIFIYMMMTTGQQMQQTQPGMPNMKFIMYLSPLIMLVFFNNYASGLSLYYFISNLITIGIMLVIKNYILDEEKIHAQVQEQKKKPKKQNRFQKKMAEMMEQAEAQQKTKAKKR